MKKLLCSLIIITLSLTGCTTYKKDIVEQKMVMTNVVSKDSRWDASTKTTHYYVTVRYANLVFEVDSYKLYNIVNPKDELQMIYTKYKNNGSYLEELETP